MKTSRLTRLLPLACALAALAFICLAPLAFGADASGTNAIDAGSITAPVNSGGASPDALVVQLAVKYPWIASLIAFIGALRVFAKPIVAIMHGMTPPGSKSYALLDAAEKSPAVALLIFALDWLCSIKLIHPQAAADSKS